MKRLTALVATATVSLGTAISVPATSTAAEVDNTGRMMLVLDSSGSMKEPAAGGQTKIAAAKQALGEVVDALPEQQAVGLRVYGAKVFSANDKGACTDSQRVVDLGTDNRDDLSSAIGDYKPYGETPIGYALQEAGKDLGNEGQRTIVLVSDGEPTCDPDPCVVAAQLSKDGIDVRIDVVGLDVSGNARKKLQCIAQKGNGTYYDAKDADDLVDSLTSSSTRATRPFDLTGKPVTGTADAANAPEITNGQYLDKIPASGSVSYRIPRTKSGSTIHVGVTLKGVQGSVGNGVSVSLDAPGEDGSPESCVLDTGGFDNGLGTRDPLLYGGASTWASEPDDPCNTSKEVIATLETTAGGDEIAGKPIEIAVYEEPPLADPSGRDLEAAAEQPGWTALRPGTPKQAVAGTSIGNAPVVTDGTYAGDLNAGESQVFAIPADWGQDVQAQLDTRVTPEVTDAAGAGSDIEVNFIGPVRDGSQVAFDEVPSDWEDEALANIAGTSNFRTGAQTQTISYLNRGDTDEDVAGGSIAGLRYVQVAYNVSGEGPNLPYTLTLKTNGTAGEGAPTYEKVDGLVAPRADSKLVDAQAPTDDQAPADNDPGSSESDPPKASSSSDGGDEAFPIVPVSLGAAGGVALLAAALVIWSTRRRSS